MSYGECMCYASMLLTFFYRFYGAQAYCKNMSLRLEFRFDGYFKFIPLSLTVPYKNAGAKHQCLFIFISSFLIFFFKCKRDYIIFELYHKM